nr:FAD-binding protein [Actinomycetota bacterium]
MADQFDLVVIGGGPGGYASAFYGASAGLNVALVEKDTIGGTCLNRGCIPAKAFLETAAARRHVEHAAEFGIDAILGSTDFAVAQARKQKIVDGLVKGLTGLVKAKKVTYLLGVGAVNADNSVTVTAADGTTSQLSGRNVVLAAGSVPRVIPGFEPSGPVMTSDEVLMLDRIPARIAVIGGGAIGCEFASTFADLGAEVTILEGLPKILPGLDADLANVVVRSFGKKKIAIKTGVAVTGHKPTGSGSTVVSFGDGETLEVDAVIVSVGRRPFTDQLGLGNTKVAVSDRGFVEVDEYCRTSVANVYAIGDLINTPQL